MLAEVWKQPILVSRHFISCLKLTTYQACKIILAKCTFSWRLTLLRLPAHITCQSVRQLSVIDLLYLQGDILLSVLSFVTPLLSFCQCFYWLYATMFSLFCLNCMCKASLAPSLFGNLFFFSLKRTQDITFIISINSHKNICTSISVEENVLWIFRVNHTDKGTVSVEMSRMIYSQTAAAFSFHFLCGPT